MMDIDVTDAPDLSGGGGGSVGPLTDFGGVGRGGHSWGSPRLGCPRDEQSERLLAGVAQPARVTVSENSLGSLCVGGTLSSSNITDLEVTNAPELSSGGPPSVPSRISVVLVDEAKAVGTPRLEYPRDDQDIRLLAGVVKPFMMTVLHRCVLGGRCPLLTLPGGSFR